MLIYTVFRRIQFVMNERMNTTYLGLFASIYYIFTTYFIQKYYIFTTFM